MPYPLVKQSDVAYTPVTGRDMYGKETAGTEVNFKGSLSAIGDYIRIGEAFVWAKGKVTCEAIPDLKVGDKLTIDSKVYMIIKLEVVYNRLTGAAEQNCIYVS
jgi:hypothetical protein